MHVERELCVEAFGIDIGIEGQRCTQPRVGELAASQRQPLVRHRVVSNVATIQLKRLAVKEVGKRLIRGGGVAQTAGSKVNASDKVLVELPIYTEARANTGPVAIRHAPLEEILTAHSHVTRETEASECGLKSRNALLFFLA